MNGENGHFTPYSMRIRCVSDDTGVAHYNFNAHQPIFVIFGRAEMLLREYAIKR